MESALTGVAQLVGRNPVKREVSDLVSGQGTCLGLWVGRDQEAADQYFSLTLMFLPLFLPPFLLSKNK